MWINEEFLVLDNGNYLFIQDSSEGGYDYEYIDGDTRLGIDGGVIEDECKSSDEVIHKALDILGLNDMDYGESSLDYWEDFA